MRIYLTQTTHYLEDSKCDVTRVAFGDGLSLNSSQFVTYAIRYVVYYLFDFMSGHRLTWLIARDPNDKFIYKHIRDIRFVITLKC